MITDWKTYSMRRDMMPPGWKDELGKRRYFEIVLINKDGQEIGRGYNIEQCVEDKTRRKGRQMESTIKRRAYCYICDKDMPVTRQEIWIDGKSENHMICQECMEERTVKCDFCDNTKNVTTFTSKSGEEQHLCRNCYAIGLGLMEEFPVNLIALNEQINREDQEAAEFYNLMAEAQ